MTVWLLKHGGQSVITQFQSIKSWCYNYTHSREYYNDLRTLHHAGITITHTTEQMPSLTSRMLNRANTEFISATEKVTLQKVNVF